MTKESKKAPSWFISLFLKFNCREFKLVRLTNTVERDSTQIRSKFIFYKFNTKDDLQWSFLNSSILFLISHSKQIKGLDEFMFFWREIPWQI